MREVPLGVPDGTRDEVERKAETMTHDDGSDRWAAGSYELVGVGGSLLPARAAVVHRQTRRVDPCRMLSGNLRLSPDKTYVVELTSEYNGAPDITFTQVMSDCGTWRYVASGLDRTSGSILMTAVNGEQTAAALTGVSLVHYAPVSMRAVQWTVFNWVYLRQDLA